LKNIPWPCALVLHCSGWVLLAAGLLKFFGEGLVSVIGAIFTMTLVVSLSVLAMTWRRLRKEQQQRTGTLVVMGQTLQVIPQGVSPLEYIASPAYYASMGKHYSDMVLRVTQSPGMIRVSELALSDMAGPEEIRKLADFNLLLPADSFRSLKASAKWILTYARSERERYTILFDENFLRVGVKKWQ
jgi:hypothetical protein